MKTVPQEKIEALCSYRWPGNVRELRNVIERAIILASDGIICFDPTPKSSPGATTSPSGPGRTLDEVGRQHILCVLENKGRVIDGTNGAARTLGLKANTLWSKMKKLGIERPTSSTSLPQSPPTTRKRTRAVRKAADSATSAPIS